MTEFDPTTDAVFRDCADLELRRHYLISEGKADSAAIAEAEQRIDALWPKFDAVQQRSLKGMGSDLNWVRRKGEPPPKGRKTWAEVKERELQELAEAMHAQEWHRVLHLLRLCAPAFRAASLARERGIAYQAIDLPGYAGVFRNCVVELTQQIMPIPHATAQPNLVVTIDVQVLVSAPKDAVLVWEANGVKVAAGAAGEENRGRAIEYKACA